MERNTAGSGQATEDQQDFSVRPAIGALTETLDDVCDQQAFVAGGAQRDELFNFLDGLRIAFITIEGQAELADVVSVQNGVEFTLGLLL
ncbi:hypothetical protein D3C85_1419210 [compost metagenome]